MTGNDAAAGRCTTHHACDCISAEVRRLRDDNDQLRADLADERQNTVEWMQSARAANQRFDLAEAKRDAARAALDRVTALADKIDDDLEIWAADRHGDEEPCDDVCRVIADACDRLRAALAGGDE